MFGPPEREGLYIPESECTALMMAFLERRTLFLIVPSKIGLFNLSKRNRSNRSCSGAKKRDDRLAQARQTQMEGEKECPPSLSSLMYLSRFDLRMTVTQFQVSNYPCSLFSTITPHN